MKIHFIIFSDIERVFVVYERVFITNIINKQFIKKNYLRIINNIKNFESKRFFYFQCKTINSINICKNKLKISYFSKNNGNFKFPLSSKIKSYLEISDISIIPLNNNPVNIRDDIHYSIKKDKSINFISYTIKDLYGNNINLGYRPSRLLYETHFLNDDEFVIIDIKKKTKKSIKKNGRDLCLELCKNKSKIIYLKRKNTSNMNISNNFYLKNTISYYT
jgi:hypothetical protein